MKTEEIKIKIQGKDGKPVYDPVQAVIVGGLAVHRGTQLDRATGKIEASGDWRITHLQSGLCVCKYFERRKDALAMAEAMGAVLDWTLPHDAVVKISRTPETLETLLALAAQYGGVLQ